MSILLFARYYISMRLFGGEHSIAVSYARNMTKARKQRKKLDQWRAQRISNLKSPFEETA
jgi:hypothetical protein